MKQTMKTNFPIRLAMGLGLLAAGLRFGLYAMGLDEKNLLAAGHPLEILVWVVAAAALGLTIFFVLPLKGTGSWEENASSGPAAALGSLALAAGIAVSTLSHWNDGGAASDLIRNVLGSFSAAGMGWVAVCRVRRKRPFFVCHALVCLFLCACLLGQYRVWSSNPQLQDYVFFLLACVCMALFAYQQAAFEVGIGSRRKLLLSGLFGGFCGLAALRGAYDLPLCLCGAVWMLTNLCPMVPPARFMSKE